MRFSVIIPLYNKEKSISRAVTSVLKQNYKNIELIIVNDGSSDNSLEVVDKIKDDRIIIINKTNGGVSSARNTGIAAANSDWICFLDADDYWKANHLEIIFELINKYQQGSIYSTLTLINEKSNKEIQNSLPDNFEGYLDDYFSYAFNGTIFNSSSVCVKKEALIEVGCFDINLKHGEDLDVWFKVMIRRKGVVKKVPTVVYDLSGENRAMLLKCKYEGHLLSKIDTYRTDKIKYLNEFIDFFILRNSVQYYFSNQKELSLPNLLKMKKNNSLTFFWKFVYSDFIYSVNLIMFKTYKIFRAI